jgi:UDP-N-acetylmuramate dehydrogenase
VSRQSRVASREVRDPDGSARDSAFCERLRSVTTGDLREHEALSRWSTYRIGGPATVLFPTDADGIAAALRACRDAGVPWFALGLGSNLLFPDAGLDALVIRVGKGLDQLEQSGAIWTLGAGLPAPLAAKRTATAGWGGIHQMVGVPGSVGGGIVMNAGCHSAEWRDTVQSVEIIGEDGERRIVAAADAGFSYRRSALGRVVVISTTVALHAEAPRRLEEEIEELYRWRKAGTPFNQPCCGSVFKNPVLPAGHPDSAPRTSGQFIEAAGLKSTRIGGVEVSPMHANYFVNTGGGKAADVLALMALAQQRVFDRWGVRLEPEVKRIGATGAVLAG